MSSQKLVSKPNIAGFKNYALLFNRVSSLFQPVSVVPKGAEVKHHELTSKSQKLMLDLGLIRQASPGCYHFLPLGVKSLDKLTKIVETEMKSIGAQQIILPSLTSSKLWAATGRLTTVSSELFQLKDRHEQDYVLSPTYEEAAADLLASVAPLSYRHFPLKLYQITSKFRDEMKPRFGLMRGKQFIMKDMYSFDVDKKNALNTYEEVCQCYSRIFQKIGVDFVKVLGSSGHMGGDLSHEFHYKADIGEDRLLVCQKCDYAANVEVSGAEKCGHCGSVDVKIQPGIEVGHTFYLGDKYTKPLNATFLQATGKPENLSMGSYGLGISRILSAVIEVLSEENSIKWPQVLAPYNIIILPPKVGSKEAQLLDPNLLPSLYEQLENLPGLENNVLVDDRTSLTIGRRFLEAQQVGYPIILVLGKKLLEETALFELNDSHTKKQHFLSREALEGYIKENIILHQE